ncbi:MAG: CPBP family glutamic-type intramembrane protease [Pyrinomonadaceae bacterium]|nr:CPBP family glutamic-type intramembrane protease [Pyrinomonadaceae bacterium]
MQNEEIINSENFPPPFQNHAFEVVETNEISPNNPPWNALTAFLVWLGSVFLIFVLQGIFVAAFAVANNRTDMTELVKDPAVLLLSVISVLPAHALTLGLAWAVVTKFNKNPFFKTLGWSFGTFRWWQFPIILGVFFIFAAVISVFFPEQENELTKILASSRAAVFVVAFMATFSAPLVEEVIYRGIVYSGFRKTFNVPVAVIVTTVLFAGVHYPQYWGSWGTIILITTLSLILTFIRVRSDNLLPCVVLHFIFNGIQSVVLILEPYLKQAAEKEQIPALILHLFK